MPLSGVKTRGLTLSDRCQSGSELCFSFSLIQFPTGFECFEREVSFSPSAGSRM